LRREHSSARAYAALSTFRSLTASTPTGLRVAMSSLAGSSASQGRLTALERCSTRPERHSSSGPCGARVTDADLRELERRFRATGSVEDESAWLRARVKAGELEQRQVTLAASFGHQGSELLQPSDGQLRSLWMLPALVGPQSEAIRRALVACGWVAWEEWRSRRQSDFDPGATPLPLDALVAEESFILCPCEIHLSQLLPGRSQLPLWARSTRLPGDRIGSLLLPVDPLDQREGEERDRHYLGVVQRELVPWALGYGDPVRERVEARQRAEAARE